MPLNGPETAHTPHDWPKPPFMFIVAFQAEILDFKTFDLFFRVKVATTKTALCSFQPSVSFPYHCFVYSTKQLIGSLTVFAYA